MNQTAQEQQEYREHPLICDTCEFVRPLQRYFNSTHVCSLGGFEVDLYLGTCEYHTKVGGE